MSSRPSQRDFVPPMHKARKFSQVLGHASEKSCKSEKMRTRVKFIADSMWKSLLTSTSQISVSLPSAGETTVLGGLVLCFSFFPFLHTSKSSLPMGRSSMAISRYTNTCCLKHKHNCSEGKASCLCCAHFLMHARVQPPSADGLRKCLWDCQCATAFLLFCVNKKVEHVSLCSGKK